MGNPRDPRSALAISAGLLLQVLQAREREGLPSDVQARVLVPQHADPAPLEGRLHGALGIVVAEHREHAQPGAHGVERRGARRNGGPIRRGDEIASQEDEIQSFVRQAAGGFRHDLVASEGTVVEVGGEPQAQPVEGGRQAAERNGGARHAEPAPLDEDPVASGAEQPRPAGREGAERAPPGNQHRQNYTGRQKAQLIVDLPAELEHNLAWH